MAAVHASNRGGGGEGGRGGGGGGKYTSAIEPIRFP